MVTPYFMPSPKMSVILRGWYERLRMISVICACLTWSIRKKRNGMLASGTIGLGVGSARGGRLRPFPPASTSALINFRSLPATPQFTTLRKTIVARERFEDFRRYSVRLEVIFTHINL